MAWGITRPKGRVRIETSKTLATSPPSAASPGRKAGCGLKQPDGAGIGADQDGITRPKGRVRIETVMYLSVIDGSNCITRPKGRVRIET